MLAGQIRFARGCLGYLPGRCQLMDLQPPHLLFLGDVVNPLDAKTAMGVLDWRPEDCIGQFRLPRCGVDLGLPDLTPEAAVALGARSLLLGVAPLGGRPGLSMGGIDSCRPGKWPVGGEWSASEAG